MNSGNFIVELADISLSNDAGMRIFDGLNLMISSGEIAIISGSTGAGKTSLIKILIGDMKPDTGVVRIFGKRMDFGSNNLLAEIRKKIGGVGGIFQPISYQTVYDNLMVPLVLRGDRSAGRRARIIHLLSQFNLSGKKSERAGNLSRGETVLLLLARAIAADQPLLLIDEPLEGMDSDMSSAILATLKRLAVAGHTLIIFTTGQFALQIPGAREFRIENGRIR